MVVIRYSNIFIEYNTNMFISIIVNHYNIKALLKFKSKIICVHTVSNIEQHMKTHTIPQKEVIFYVVEYLIYRKCLMCG